MPEGKHVFSYIRSTYKFLKQIVNNFGKYANFLFCQQLRINDGKQCGKIKESFEQKCDALNESMNND